MLTRDNLRNLVTELGTEKDKASHSFFVRLLLSKSMLDAVYTSGGIGGKVVDCVAEDAGRKWRRITIPDKDPKPFLDLEKALDVNSKFVESSRWARLYGGSVILCEIEGDNPATELDEETVSPNKPVTALHVVDRYDMVPEIINQSTGIPETYTDSTTGIRWDASRVLGPFDGLPLPAQLRRNNNGWGESILARPYRSLLSEATSAAQITTLLHEIVVDVIGVANLSTFLDGGEKQRAFTERYALMKQMKSINGVMLVDSDFETYESKATAANLAGLAPLMESFAQRIASEVDIPISRLYGKMVGGLGDSAETNQEDYQSSVSGWQKFREDAFLARLDRLMALSVYGMVPEGLTYEWVPLGEPSAKEKSETLNVLADALGKLVTMGAIVPAHVVEYLASDATLDISDEYLTYVKERDGLIGGPPELPDEEDPDEEDPDEEDPDEEDPDEEDPDEEDPDEEEPAEAE